jgi:Family of unknown function (DUF5706)
VHDLGVAGDGAGPGPDPFAGVSGRGPVDYMLRNTQQALIAFTGQADLKASIMITSCSVVLTLAFGHRASGEAARSLAIFTAFAGVALVLAILAVLPKHRSPGRSWPEGLNLLFFGHFASMSRDRFLFLLGQAVRDDEAVYRLIATDVYELGHYLEHHKYRYLRLAYGFFLTGAAIAAALEVQSLL